MVMKPWVYAMLSLFLFAGCIQSGEVSEDNTPSPLQDTSVNNFPAEDTGSETPLSEEEEYWQQRMDAAFEKKPCPIPIAPQYPSTSYQGRLVDAHIHFTSIPDAGPGAPLPTKNDSPSLGANITIPEYVCTFQQDGTPWVLSFFPVWKPIEEYHLAIAERTIQEYPGIFVPFIMTPDNDGSPTGYPTVDAATLEEFLSTKPGLFKGYGEIGLYARTGGAPALSPNSSRLKEIYPVIRKHNLVVYFHVGENMEDAFAEVLSENPDITFIFHGDQLITQKDDGSQDLSKIDTLLSDHPNLYYEIDELWGDVWLLKPGEPKEKFLDHFEDYEPLLEYDVKTWGWFIEKHQDQVVWGTDRGPHNTWDFDHEVAFQLQDYVRAFIGRLPVDVQEKYAYKNAEKIFEEK
jgi:hypothetical protein